MTNTTVNILSTVIPAIPQQEHLTHLVIPSPMQKLINGDWCGQVVITLAVIIARSAQRDIGGVKMQCDCCGTDLTPKHDSKPVYQAIAVIADREYTLCQACMHTIRWVQAKQNRPTDGNL